MAKNIYVNEIGVADWSGKNFTLPDGLDPSDPSNYKSHVPYTDPRVSLNHGWKIHGDFGSRMSPDEAAARLGLAFNSPQYDLRQGFKTIDKTKRLAAQARVNALMKDVPNPAGVDHFQDWLGTFFGHHESRGHPSGIKYGKKHPPQSLAAEGVPEFIDPLDMLSLQEAMTESGIEYKVNPERYGRGRHFTAYPQSLEHRDRLIGILEARVSSGDLNLVPQNDPAYRAKMGGGEGGKGNKNHPLSTHIQGRFTTDYASAPDPVTGVIDYASDKVSSPRTRQGNYW
jgi:hypothetical protein